MESRFLSLSLTTRLLHVIGPESPAFPAMRFLLVFQPVEMVIDAKIFRENWPGGESCAEEILISGSAGELGDLVGW